ncbi:MAG: hypothetical protein ACXVAX_07210 [Pseudobdellovibrio sp.]
MSALLHFNIYGFKLTIQSKDYDLSELKIQKDFVYFRTNDGSQDQDLSIHINHYSEPENPGFRLFKTSMCSAYQISTSVRLLKYEAGARAWLSDSFVSNRRKAVLSCENLDIANDILYFYVNSAAGEYLDLNGYMRIHAFSYLQNDTAHLVYGKPGTGKSTLALKLLKSPNVKIYSDEISLLSLKDRKLYPYPIRISSPDEINAEGGDSKFQYLFKTKFLLPIPPERIATGHFLNQIHFLPMGRRSSPLFYLEIILGIGLIQMFEFFVRPGGLPVLFRIFLNRLQLAFLLFKCPKSE